MKKSKRFKSASTKVEAKKLYTIDEAVARVKETATAKFAESVDIAVRLGVDPKKADQAIRGTVDEGSTSQSTEDLRRPSSTSASPAPTSVGVTGQILPG